VGEIIQAISDWSHRSAVRCGCFGSAVVSHENRIFAISFGYGKNLLAEACWIQDFGLKVTLNRVDPSKLRSIDAKTYEDLVLVTRKQTSRKSTVDSFQLDVGRDLVSAVAGEPSDTTFFKRVAGADSLKVATELPFSELDAVLTELLAAYKDTRYKQQFDWIDQIRQVDPAIKNELDNALLASLKEHRIENMHLAPADVVEWEEIDGFNFTGGGKTVRYLELELERYLEAVHSRLEALTVEQLKRHKVRVWLCESEQFQDRWSVYECIVWETELRDRKYVIFSGRWFEINLSYAEKVTAFVVDATSNALRLPDATFGMEERDYNENVASSNPNEFALLDRVTFKPSGASSSIEICDLLSARSHFIHVKKRSSSATLSHLFSQGGVSCDLFLQDPSLRAQVRKHLEEQGKQQHAELFPESRPVASSYEIVYVVISTQQDPWAPKLPFFSAVNFMHHASRIRNLNFSVKLQHVKQSQAQSRRHS
jgi:uncharacterized protein (TIGR04141 family)